MTAMATNPDLISFIEDSYDIYRSEEEWLQSLCHDAIEIYSPDWMRGAIGYHVNFSEGGRTWLSSIVGAGDCPERVIQGLHKFNEWDAAVHGGRGSLGDKAAYWSLKKLYSVGQRLSLETFFLSETKFPTTVLTMGMGGAKDMLCFRAPHLDGSGYLTIGLPFKSRPSAAARNNLTNQMLSAHVQSAARLRNRLRLQQGQQAASALSTSNSEFPPAEGAVIDARSGRIVHADGAAQSSAMQEEIRYRVRQVDAARSQSSGRGVEAVKAWKGLLSGQWSVVDRHDSAGRRYIVLHKNREKVSDPRGLTEDEARVVAYAARGLANKMIAYQLGVSESAVTTQLRSAFVKLKVQKRSALRKVLGI
ncbi:MAG: helix-turn-helix transcriptional regulator [Polyangiaceae bacterium]|nr:helix-turn-helix transcriptional regulator [Polyangiaceae bacterium]